MVLAVVIGFEKVSDVYFSRMRRQVEDYRLWKMGHGAEELINTQWQHEQQKKRKEKKWTITYEERFIWLSKDS